MIQKIMFLMAFFVIAIFEAVCVAQDSQLYMPIDVRKAYDNKTRSCDGLPGPNYWQNKADYKMKINFEPDSKQLSGNAEIVYFNNSPDTLKEIYFHLYPNLFQKGQARDSAVDFEDLHDGVVVEDMTINGADVDTTKENKKFEIKRTLLKVALDSYILPKERASVNISWNYALNSKSYIRTGAADSSSFFIAYFFPHIAVYDDIGGWNEYQYTGNTEFYNDFGDFDVEITVPKDFVVWATGEIQNPKDVLQEKYFRRWKKAISSDEIVHIVDSTDIGPGNITTQHQKNSWKFKAKNVPDFAFATSDHYLWDGSSLVVDKKTGRRTFIDAAYDKTSPDFYKVAEISRQAIEYMSFEFPAVSFPYPKITIYNGGAEGGMEYPMMVGFGSAYGAHSVDYPNKENYVINLTAHEIYHTYLPFYTGINEAKYAWMDEGWATFSDFQFGNTVIKGDPFAKSWKHGWHYIREGQYMEFAGTEVDVPIFCPANLLNSPSLYINAYPKAALFYLVLQDLLGEETFRSAIQEFMNRWNGNHPIPYDFFNTMKFVGKQDLDWLVKPWIFEFGYPDLAIKNVENSSGKYKIDIERVGNFPMPINIKLTFDDSTSETLHESVAAWKSGDRIYSTTVLTSKKLLKVKVGSEILPDADLSNNVFVLE